MTEKKANRLPSGHFYDFDKKYNNEYYNLAYKRSEEYKKHYSNFVFLSLIKNIEFLLSKYFDNRKDIKILDIGCGAGQMANYLEDNGYLNYTGIDFSEEAIKMSEQISSYRFFNEDLYNSENIKKDYDAIIGCEVLEHLADDLSVLSKIKKNTFCIFSVPTFGGKGHARYFEKKKNIIARYGELINVQKEIISINKTKKRGKPKWFVFCGYKR